MEATGNEWINSYGDFRIVLPDGTISTSIPLLILLRSR